LTGAVAGEVCAVQRQGRKSGRHLARGERAIAGNGTTERRHRGVRLLNRIAATDIAASQAGNESMVQCRGEFARW
jgi:hypothetical protein